MCSLPLCRLDNLLDFLVGRGLSLPHSVQVSIDQADPEKPSPSLYRLDCWYLVLQHNLEIYDPANVTGPVELTAFCLSCNTTGTSTASSKDCAGWMNGDLVCETHCRNHLLDAEVLPRQRTDMNGIPTSKTRLLLPAAAVVENDLNVWWKLPQQLRGSQRRREGFWGLLPVYFRVGSKMSFLKLLL